jgi:hypothetical protein
MRKPAERFREYARIVQDLAEETAAPEIRATLLRVATLYEELARQAERLAELLSGK